VFVDAPMEHLASRDGKGLYASAKRGETANVVGVDIDFPRPTHPDMVIDNKFEELDARVAAARILRGFDGEP